GQRHAEVPALGGGDLPGRLSASGLFWALPSPPRTGKARGSCLPPRPWIDRLRRTGDLNAARDHPRSRGNITRGGFLRERSLRRRRDGVGPKEPSGSVGPLEVLNHADRELLGRGGPASLVRRRRR